MKQDDSTGYMPPTPQATDPERYYTFLRTVEQEDEECPREQFKNKGTSYSFDLDLSGKNLKSTIVPEK